MDEHEVKGEYVGSGGFRVDRARMLEKLGRYGYANAQLAITALVRAAVLGGATYVKIRGLDRKGLTLKTFDGLEVEFDGQPFGEEDLRHPYDCLFADGSDRARRSQLARALLTISRAAPKELTVRSGRFELSVRSASEETLTPVEGDGPTKLRVTWEGFGAPQAELLYGISSTFYDKFQRCPIPVSALNVWHGQGDYRSRSDYSVTPRLSEGESVATFVRGGLRGETRVPDRVVPAMGHVELYWAGVFVEKISDAPFLPVPADGFIESARFNLDLSAGAVVRDDAYEEAIAVLARESAALTIRLARMQAGVMEEAAAQMAAPAGRDAWTATHDGRLEIAPDPSWWDRAWSSDAEIAMRREVFALAARTRWLRYCAQKVLDGATAPPDLVEAMLQAPLYFSTKLEPLTLSKLKSVLESQGTITASARFGATLPAGPVLWLSSTRDAALLPKRYVIKRMK